MAVSPLPTVSFRVGDDNVHADAVGDALPAEAPARDQVLRLQVQEVRRSHRARKPFQVRLHGRMSIKHCLS